MVGERVAHGFSSSRAGRATRTQRVKVKSKIPEFSGFSSRDDPLGVSRDILMELRPQRNKIPEITYGKTTQDEFDFSDVEKEFKNEIIQLREQLAEIKSGRQALANFGSVPITLDCDDAQKTLPLSSIAQITIKSATVVIIRALESQHVNAIMKSLKCYNEKWALHRDQGNEVRLALPKSTKQTREAFAAEAKEIYGESIKRLKEIEEDCELDIRSSLTNTGWGAKETKCLRQLAKEYRDEAQQELKKKLQQLTIQ